MDANQAFFKFLVYYPVVWSRGQRVPGYLERLLASERRPATELQSLQAAKLRRMLRYARRAVPHYGQSLAGLSEATLHRDDAPASGGTGRARPTDASPLQAGSPRCTGAAQAGLAGLELLRSLPTVAKADLKRDPAAFVSRDAFRLLTRKTTGGSTGEPVTILKTRDAMAWELAATWRGYGWAGVDIGDRQGRFWGVPLDNKGRAKARLIDLVTNRLRCSAFSFDDRDLRVYAQRLRAFRPAYLYGYVSMIDEYARFVQRTGLTPPPGLKAVITTSEVLTDAHRRRIEQALGARVFNEYGSGELGTVAHECEHGRLHVSAENLIVEVLDGDRPCAPGEPGELVVTELNNLAMPLIRYRTGDFASLSGQPCPCGRHLPVIENLFGRAYDVLRNRAGKTFHAEYLMYIFEEAQRRDLGIQAFQVVQQDMDRFRIRIVPQPHYGPPAERFVTDRLRSGFDPQAEVCFERVERIERLASGKMQLIVGMQPTGH